ncbi:MAG: Hcp family type VI secretion system effector [Actinomycetota bacterium]
MRIRAINVRTTVLAAVSLAVLLLGVVVNGPADDVSAQGAAADYFLKIETIEGDVANGSHTGAIAVESWSWGETNSTQVVGSGAGAGKVKVNDFHFTMRVSKATPKLMLYCAQGRVIPTVTLTGVADGQTFIVWELKNVIISSYSIGADRTSGPPTDAVKMRFSRIVVTHITHNADGTQTRNTAGWDLAKAKSV